MAALCRRSTWNDAVNTLGADVINVFPLVCTSSGYPSVGGKRRTKGRYKRIDRTAVSQRSDGDIRGGSTLKWSTCSISDLLAVPQCGRGEPRKCWKGYDIFVACGFGCCCCCCCCCFGHVGPKWTEVQLALRSGLFVQVSRTHTATTGSQKHRDTHAVHPHIFFFFFFLLLVHGIDDNISNDTERWKNRTWTENDTANPRHPNIYQSRSGRWTKSLRKQDARWRDRNEVDRLLVPWLPSKAKIKRGYTKGHLHSSMSRKGVINGDIETHVHKTRPSARKIYRCICLYL